jgi:hypothetical protein
MLLREFWTSWLWTRLFEASSTSYWTCLYLDRRLDMYMPDFRELLTSGGRALQAWLTDRQPFFVKKGLVQHITIRERLIIRPCQTEDHAPNLCKEACLELGICKYCWSTDIAHGQVFAQFTVWLSSKRSVGLYKYPSCVCKVACYFWLTWVHGRNPETSWSSWRNCLKRSPCSAPKQYPSAVFNPSRMMWRRRTQARSVSLIVGHLLLLLETHRWQQVNHNQRNLSPNPRRPSDVSSIDSKDTHHTKNEVVIGFCNLDIVVKFIAL